MTKKMLLETAVTTLGVINSLLLLQTATEVSSSGYVGDSLRRCPSDAVSSIWTGMAECRPREEMVKLPLPEGDPDVVEVVPSHVLVPRCSGVCHQGGNFYHECVPTEGGRGEVEMEVMLRRLDSTIDQIECSLLRVETHSQCQCGCDVTEANCTDKQAYDEHFCKCRCSDAAARTACADAENRETKTWDEELCACVCRPEEFRDCSTGFVYDAVDTCGCVEMSDSTLATAGVASLAAVLVVLVGVVSLVAWQYKNNKRLKKQLRQLQQQHNEGEREALNAKSSVAMSEEK